MFDQKGINSEIHIVSVNQIRHDSDPATPLRIHIGPASTSRRVINRTSLFRWLTLGQPERAVIVKIDEARELRNQLVSRLLPPATHAWTRPAAHEPGGRITRSIGVGMSHRESGGYRLELRLEERDLREHPAVAALLSSARGEVNVEVTGRISALGARHNPYRSRHRPLRVGHSVGHGLVGAGTLGCFVRFLGQPGTVGVLSNNHVLAATNRGTIGDPIFQPGMLDSGCPNDRIGTLSHLVPLEERKENQLDVAAATLDPGIETMGNFLPEGVLEKVDEPSFDDDLLAKVGRSTGHTKGHLSATEVDLMQVEYRIGEAEFRYFNFSNVIEITGTHGFSFSAAGDSGSMVYSPRTRVGYAMIFAGNEVANRSYAMPLPAALHAVKAEPLNGTEDR
ncbi:hypothetical protein F9278_44560 [Streptomyces phaeolivaceus]|uniref:Trypsin-like peptidase domain-containing protein n=1 Tax=Streptomyces phaeolivaceus TaxID=2653200 RepID=A0A5P8KHR0_9ACTN|nr:hypothetical protein [Streptomyces phaeolivaceus]QFR02070.1 hypothetical protein F9278_44560 [Streptomyces phaeolivaceus]